MPRVLIIDDLPNSTIEFADGLTNAGFTVEVRNRVQAALNYLESPHADLEAVVIDIIMPPEKFGSELTLKGTRTGIFLYEQICKMEPLRNAAGRPMPLAFLTNSRESETREILHQKQLAMRPQEKGHYYVWPKEDLEVHNFVEEFKEFLAAVNDIYQGKIPHVTRRKHTF